MALKALTIIWWLCWPVVKFLRNALDYDGSIRGCAMVDGRKDSMPQSDCIYPFQVALAVSECSGDQMEFFRRICATFEIQPQMRWVHCTCSECFLFCFASDNNAQKFNRTFGGEYLVEGGIGDGRSTRCSGECRPPRAIH